MTTSSGLGAVRLSVAAAGRWAAVVEQQFDSALHEPPLRDMPTGRLALRLERLRLPPTTGMFLWLSGARRPMTSKQAIAGPPTKLRELKSTLGEQNYVLPERLGVDRARSVVIWYGPPRTAYIAAAL